MLKPFKTAGAIVALSGMLLTSGCSGSSSPASDATDSLRIGVAQTPTSLDPGQGGGYRQSYAILQLISGTLTSMDRDGKNVSMGLAASMEPRDKQFVFKLKPGLKFSDGSALTARDVVASFEHYLADKASGNSFIYEPIEKVTATDDLTVEFDLKRPYPSLPAILATPPSAIIPAKSIESKGLEELYKGDPLPTAGQFEVKTFDQNQITLQANPNYAGEQPTTKTLVFKKITDATARLAQVQGGGIDFADDITPKSIPQISAPLEASTAAAVNGAQFLVMNNRETATLSDVRIRQAISLAINRNQINQVAWAGQNQPALSVFPGDSPYNAPFVKPDVDVQRAKEQLAGTKCANGCTLRLIVNSDNEPRNDAAIVAQQNLKAVGIQVNIEKSEGATILTYAKDGNFDLAFFGTYDNTPDSYLGFLLDPSDQALYSGYSSPEMDRLLKEVTITSDAERDAAIRGINALIAKDMPFTPIAENSFTSVSRVTSERFTVDPGFFFHVG